MICSLCSQNQHIGNELWVNGGCGRGSYGGRLVAAEQFVQVVVLRVTPQNRIHSKHRDWLDEELVPSLQGAGPSRIHTQGKRWLTSVLNRVELKEVAMGYYEVMRFSSEVQLCLAQQQQRRHAQEVLFLFSEIGRAHV